MGASTVPPLEGVTLGSFYCTTLEGVTLGSFYWTTFGGCNTWELLLDHLGGCNTWELLLYHLGGCNIWELLLSCKPSRLQCRGEISFHLNRSRRDPQLFQSCFRSFFLPNNLTLLQILKKHTLIWILNKHTLIRI